MGMRKRNRAEIPAGGYVLGAFFMMWIFYVTGPGPMIIIAAAFFQAWRWKSRHERDRTRSPATQPTRDEP